MKHWYIYILATLLTFTVASCADDDMEFRLDAESNEVYVSVMLNIGGSGEMTRATIVAPGNSSPTLEMENGSFQESYIDPEDVELFVFDQNDKYVSNVNILWRTHMGNTTNADNPSAPTPYQCSIHGSIEMENLTDGNYHLVAVCNQKGKLQGTKGSLSEKTTTLDEFISSLTYSGYEESFTRTLLTGHTGTADETNINAGNYKQDARIPMWGICTVRLAKGEATTAPMAVLRAMAKVRVTIGGEARTSGFTLNGCTLNIANQKGYLAAQKNGDTPQAYVTTTDNNGTADDSSDDIKTYTTAWNTDESASPANATPITIPSIVQENPIATTSTPLPFSKVTENDKDCYIIYIPEYNHFEDNGEESVQNPATISLSITQNGHEVKDQDGNDYLLHFADYSNNATPSEPEWDIIRNDIYDYTITKIIETDGLEANVRVMPWQYETMEYELSQNAVVMLTSSANAVFNYDLYRYSNEVLYSADGNMENYATFTIKVKEPKGVRWVAHLTDPYNFTFTEDSETYGFGGDDDKEYTITVKPRGQFTKVLETDLYFTVETLIDATPQIAPVDANGKFVTGNYGITNNSLHIAQVSTRTGSSDDTVPFTVDMSAWGTAVSSGTALIADAKAGYYSYSGLTYPTGIETKTIYKGTTNAMCNNGVVMAAYNGTLYCMWQSSANKEDTPDTHIKYSTSTDDGINWSTPQNLTTPYGYDKGYTSSGGWLVADDRLIAYVNTWTGDATITGNPTDWNNLTKPLYGYTRYIDMSNTSVISDVTMEGGGQLTAIFEQDPHVITLPDGTKRIINAGHFQNIGSYSNGLYVNPIYADYTNDGITGWKQADFSFTESNGTQSREMEPSVFRKANGDLVMIFRDNMKINESGNDGEKYTHRVRASVSHDYGLTWSTPVETNLYDSKSKQCAGNLPDGTAFIVNNPVQSETRSPLVIHLSKDGETFNQSYLLRTGYTQAVDPTGGIQDREETAGSGYVYPKAMVHGDYLYVSYSTNKEDVEYTRIPLSSIQLNDPSAR